MIYVKLRVEIRAPLSRESMGDLEGVRLYMLGKYLHRTPYEVYTLAVDTFEKEER